MINKLNGNRCWNKFCFYLGHDIENKLVIGLLNTVIDKLKNLNI